MPQQSSEPAERARAATDVSLPGLTSVPVAGSASRAVNLDGRHFNHTNGQIKVICPVSHDNLSGNLRLAEISDFDFNAMPSYADFLRWAGSSSRDNKYTSWGYAVASSGSTDFNNPQAQTLRPGLPYTYPLGPLALTCVIPATVNGNWHSTIVGLRAGQY